MITDKSLREAEMELQAHLASWAYAYAMGDRHNDHPVHRKTRARTVWLQNKVNLLRAIKAVSK